MKCLNASSSSGLKKSSKLYLREGTFLKIFNKREKGMRPSIRIFFSSEREIINGPIFRLLLYSEVGEKKCSNTELKSWVVLVVIPPFKLTQ